MNNIEEYFSRILTRKLGYNLVIPILAGPKQRQKNKVYEAAYQELQHLYTLRRAPTETADVDTAYQLPLRSHKDTRNYMRKRHSEVPPDNLAAKNTTADLSFEDMQVPSLLRMGRLRPGPFGHRIITNPLKSRNGMLPLQPGMSEGGLKAASDRWHHNLSMIQQPEDGGKEEQQRGEAKSHILLPTISTRGPLRHPSKTKDFSHTEMQPRQQTSKNPHIHDLLQRVVFNPDKKGSAQCSQPKSPVLTKDPRSTEGTCPPLSSNHPIIVLPRFRKLLSEESHTASHHKYRPQRQLNIVIPVVVNTKAESVLQYESAPVLKEPPLMAAPQKPILKRGSSSEISPGRQAKIVRFAA